jgi:hypothetical protein
MTDRPILSLNKNEQPSDKRKLAQNEVLIEINKLKVTLPLKPEQLPESVLPPEGKGGNVTLTLQINDDNKPMMLSATLNAKNYRKILKTIKEKESEGEVFVLLTGSLNAKRIIEGAGMSVTVKPIKPATEQPGETTA